MFNAAARRAIEGVAEDIDVPADALLAVAEVESAGKAFAMVNGEHVPLIRWEGHYFDKLVPAEKRGIARKAGLANPKAGAVKNPSSQEKRYAMLERARAIDETAAISSCSWGIGQVMGSHWKWLGYASAEVFEKEVRSSIAGQVRVMAKYIVKAGLDDELRRHDWSGFARGYNGPAYARYGYHTKIARAYERYAGATAPASSASGMLRLGSSGAAVRELQQLLVRAGHAVNVDGDYGPATKRAVIAFQKAQRLTVDGVAGPKTMAALQHFKTSPDEQPGKQGPLETEEAKQAAGALGGAVGVETASQAIEQAAEKTSWVPGMEQISAILTLIAVLLVLGGLAWAAYGWWKSRKTYEGTS